MNYSTEEDARKELERIMEVYSWLTATGYRVRKGESFLNKREELMQYVHEFKYCIEFIRARKRPKYAMSSNITSAHHRHEVEAWQRETNKRPYLYIPEGAFIAAGLSENYRYDRQKKGTSVKFNMENIK